MENKQTNQPQDNLPEEAEFLPEADPVLEAELNAAPAEDPEIQQIHALISEEPAVDAQIITEEIPETEITTFEAEIPASDAETPASEAELSVSEPEAPAEEISEMSLEEILNLVELEEPSYDEGYRETSPDPDFNNLFEAPEAPARNTEVVKTRPPRKGRPKRKKGYGFFGIPHLIATAIWLAIIVSIGVSLGRMMWLCAADVLAFGRQDKAVTITIAAEDTIEDISNKLHNAGLIRYPGLFRLYAGLAVDDGEIATGTFTLNTLYDYHAIVNGMSAYSSFRNVIEDVLIPEGYNCRQIFQLLEEKGICSAAELEAYAADGVFSDYWFLEDVVRGDKYCLEGFLFPDTYDFYEGSTPREALGKMLTAFEKRFTEDMRSQIDTLNATLSAKMKANGCSQDYIDEHLFSVYDVVIVASLIEEETASAAESANIASVIYNRLTQDQAHERYLGIDATILYALGEHKDVLTAEDLAIDSPYNTRTHSGLIPTPITNPGLNSLMAALEPADTAYYYYLLNPSTGNHTFSKTGAEHDALKEKYGY